MSGRRFSGASLLLVALAASAASCNRSVDIKQALEVVDVSSGWYDAGIVEGKNKIVPSVTFKLRKKPGADLSVIALNIAFRYVPPPGSNVEEPWEDFFVQRAEFKNGNETDPLVVGLNVLLAAHAVPPGGIRQ